MKTVWNIKNGELLLEPEKIGEEDFDAYRLVIYTIKEADSNLYIEKKNDNSAISISLKGESIVVVEKDGKTGDQTATWVPFLTYAIGAIHDFMIDRESDYIIRFNGQDEDISKVDGQPLAIEDACIKWLAYEHKKCLERVENE